MNLADIRKKAQERGGGAPVEPAPAVAQPDSQLETEAVPDDVGGESVQPEAEPFSQQIEELFTREERPVLPVTAAETASRQFDPLAQLLEGRETAGCDDDAVFMTAAATETREFQEFLCFRVAEENYAVNIMEIKEIIKPREVTEVPRVPRFVIGILSLRGIIIPVYDMRQRLGFTPREQTGKSRIIVVKRQDEFSGLMVDEVVQVVRIETASIEPPPAVLDGIDREFVNGLGRFGAQMLILLNMEKILDISLH